MANNQIQILTGTTLFPIAGEDTTGTGTPMLLRTNSQAAATANVSFVSGVAGGTIRASGPGRLCKVLITSGGATGAMVFWDATSGSLGGVCLGIITSGQYALNPGVLQSFDMPYQSGLSWTGTSGTLGCQVSYY